MTPVRLSWLLLASLMLLAGCHRQSAGGVAQYPDFADLVEGVSPSVVNVSTVPTETQQLASGDQAHDDADSLKEAPEWFKRFLQRHGEEEQDTQPETPGDTPDGPQSLGSGFILWEDGYILTNFHVVRDAKEVVVRLLDRRQFTAQVVGSDEASDIALLKIDARNLPVVKIGDAGKLRPGQWALAIGSPFGFDYSVTVGIVSAKGRALPSEQYVPFIQTDVAINPGNSGGPLFNTAGEVIGVNSQIYSQSGGYQGLSFSIPIDIAVKVARQLKEQGHVMRGWLGVVVQEVDRDMAQQAHMDKPEGALVAKLMADSPALKSGLREGDIILRFNGQDLPSSSALPPLVGVTDPGKIATLDVLREGKAITVKVEVGSLSPDASQAEPAGPSGGPLGLMVRPLSADERSSAKVVGQGVLVVGVQEGPAARAGVRENDVLLQIAGQEIGSFKRLQEVVARLTPGSSVQLLVQRRGAPLFLTLDVPTPDAFANPP
ncbi:serine protease Do [Solimonas aquatica]|uniref:Probable periplasmic serine endoprotease DegP-like n=1 Tax=Solimonas aquatica TaxID=489703 RepID=A0A1H9HC81_9GAMM|nr:Do family serine endopeptidase [Solimonas aquatica]SEQ59903.1 serine protease Do [Solimonas aquatica]